MRGFIGYLIGALALTLVAGCDVEQTEEGELPDVNVEGGQMPEYDVDQTQEGELPDVDAQGGNMPEYDVDAPDVDVDTDTKEVTVPDVDIDVDAPEDKPENR